MAQYAFEMTGKRNRQSTEHMPLVSKNHRVKLGQVPSRAQTSPMVENLRFLPRERTT